MKNWLLISLLFVLIISACSSTPTPEPTATQAITDLPTEVTEGPTPEPTPYEVVTVKINTSPSLGMAPFYIAEEKGFFEDYGIQMEYVQFPRSNDAIPLISTGDMDIYTGPITPGLFNVLLQDPNMKVVANRGSIIVEGCSYTSILVRKDLFDAGIMTKPEDFKGKKVVVNTTGSRGFYLGMYLGNAGLSLNDIEPIGIPDSSFVDAFAEKSVDAIVAVEPSITRVIKAGNAVEISRLNDFGNIQLSVIVFGKNLTVDHPDIGIRFIAAYLAGVEAYNEGKTEENIQILIAASGETEEIVRESCWVPIPSRGDIDFSTVDIFQQWALDQKLMDTPVTKEQFWDPQYLVAAQELLDK